MKIGISSAHMAEGVRSDVGTFVGSAAIAFALWFGGGYFLAEWISTQRPDSAHQWLECSLVDARQHYSPFLDEVANTGFSKNGAATSHLAGTGSRPPMRLGRHDRRV